MIEKIKKALQVSKDADVPCSFTREQASFLLGYLEGLEAQFSKYVNPRATNGKPDYFYSKPESK
jgi:hypothetical protein